MIEPANPILSKMLERLFASMVNGPAMNCRPHASRQRVDLASLSRLKDSEPAKALHALLGPDRSIKLTARVAVPAKGAAARRSEEGDEPDELSPEERAARQAWSEQQSILTKLRVIADDARTYEQDTGVHALNLGFPLLSLPPGTFGGRAGVASRRVLAPIAFIPATLTIKSGSKQVIELAAHGEGVDLVIPNVALLSWLEQQTGQPLVSHFDDEKGEDPWREIVELVRLIAQRVDIPVPEMFAGAEMLQEFSLAATPRSDEDEKGPSIVTSAVLGLFPTSNQGLLTDTKQMLAGGAPDGPLDSFVRHGVSLDAVPATPDESAPPEPPTTPTEVGIGTRVFTNERLVTMADPCQTRAVRLARESRGLVIHGPPGTGKSQTIANVIGDHLARGERVLFVCDKRTALDVVADRLNSLGLGDLCATVHDPQRDQREFYRSVREQLDNLADTAIRPAAADKLAKIDAELQMLHDELTEYYRELMGHRGGAGSFHHLVGQWLAETGEAGDVADWDSLQNLQASDFERQKGRLKETLERGEAVEYAKNPWKAAAGLGLSQFLARPMDAFRGRMQECQSIAAIVDATADAMHPPFDPKADLTIQAAARQRISEQLTQLQPPSVESAGHWVKQSATDVQTARAVLNSAANWVAEVKSGALDEALRKAIGQIPQAEQIAADRKVLVDYADAFELRAGQYARVRAAAPGVDDAIVLKWMLSDNKAIQAARKRLDGAATVADAVDGSTLDPSLLARFEAAPIDPSKVFEALASLNAYLDIAGKWTAVFQGGKKKAAEPFVRHFGLSLTPESASQVRNFLADNQKRTDLRGVVEAATGQTFDARPDDVELLAAFRQNREVLHALDLSPTNEPAGQKPNGLSEPVVAAVNGLLGPVADSAKSILDRLGLRLCADMARRAVAFLIGLDARVGLAALLGKLAIQPPPTADTPDAELIRLAEWNSRLFELLAQLPEQTPLHDAVARALTEPGAAAAIINALARSPARATAILKAEPALADFEMFSDEYLAILHQSICAGHQISLPIASLTDRLDTLEGVIRVTEGLASLPPELSAAAAALLDASCGSAAGFSAIRRNVLAGEIIRRLKANPNLQTIDGHRLRSAFSRFRELSQSKKDAVRDLIQHHWVGRQKERLLASTGSRLNGAGADLRRRLTTRGERAMRLRQVISHGAGVDGGDPLFDLRPVWMASPETVAQLFPREAIFAVVVFDEASQCRLEEALPVLARAKRVVIAGDPKQLPPTRFFESAVSTSEGFDADTDQELFESHQGEVEDLLTAALGLDVDQCYLDVHYRSRNADLIGFSNEHFYGSRLQAIPGHPRNRTRYAPITLYRVDGTYEKRRNAAEADAVCKIVKDLLKRAAPPSIGIGCFNMVQRDLIVEKLEEQAEQDPDFARRLAEARERRGPGSSEGLFVKNLENVQGDERDHLIISTTYGPDAAGKFRRSFGPLGTAGGGRRLNVLVTRARDELHLVTSIPRAVYTSLPPIPPGTSPSGAWLLFAYLHYAQQLGEEYEINHRIIESTGPAEQASVNPRPTRTPSHFAKALATKLAALHNHGSDVPWGNEGFSVDLAMQHPTRAEDVTIGVLCDMTRFAGSDDPVEWDVFRTAIHESQGWKLHRVWTPHFFRDPVGAMKEIAASIEETLKADKEAAADA